MFHGKEKELDFPSYMMLFGPKVFVLMCKVSKVFEKNIKYPTL